MNNVLYSTFLAVFFHKTAFFNVFILRINVFSSIPMSNSGLKKWKSNHFIRRGKHCRVIRSHAVTQSSLSWNTNLKISHFHWKCSVCVAVLWKTISVKEHEDFWCDVGNYDVSKWQNVLLFNWFKPLSRIRCLQGAENTKNLLWYGEAVTFFLNLTGGCGPHALYLEIGEECSG